jgi:hypothetical protein
MNGKVLMSIIAIFAMIGSIGAASAETVTFHGFNPGQSIGTAGIQNWQTNTGQKLQGLCVDAFTWITKGKHTVTTGTKQIKNANIVKELILKYYNTKMTKINGYNLQYAIWSFTNGVKPVNAAQKSMIASAKHSTTKIPDIYTKISSKVITFTGPSSTTTYTPITTSTTTSNVINLVNKITQTFKCGCHETLVTYNRYSNTTTTNTTTSYNTVVTTKQTYTTTTKGNTITFNSIIKGPTQKIILFTVKPYTKTNSTVKSKTTTTPYANSIITCNTNYFCNKTVQVVNIPCKPCTPVKPPCKTHETCKPVKCKYMEVI